MGNSIPVDDGHDRDHTSGHGTHQPTGAAQSLTPGQLMGLGGLLRAWRSTAEARMGEPLTQKDVAGRLGRSVRWYQDLEGGVTVRLDRNVCESLADILQLGRDERHALVLHSIGGSLEISTAPGDHKVRRALNLLMNKQMPSPTYLTDNLWNIVGYNQAMAEWWPWVLKPKANLMRWALTNPEAKAQYVDWPQHVAAYLRLLKFALARHPNNADLIQLITDVCKVPEVRKIWESSTDLTENRDGDVFRMKLPTRNWETVEVVSHVLYPASLPDYRLVVITFLQSESGADEESDHTAANESWGHEVHPHATTHWEGEAAATDGVSRIRRLSVGSPEEAARLAGDDRQDLPVLSQLLGGGSRLTLSPSTGAVIWATPEADGRWDIIHTDAESLAARLPHAATVHSAQEDYSALTRAMLPANPDQAINQIKTLLAQARGRIRTLEALNGKLVNAPRRRPYNTAPPRAS